MVIDFAKGRVASPVQIVFAVIRVRGIASIVDMRNQLSIVCNGLLAGLFFGALVSCADDAPKPKLPAAFPVQTTSNASAVSAPTAVATNAISSASSNVIAATKPETIPLATNVISPANSNVTSSANSNAIASTIPAAVPSVDPLTSSATSNPSLIELPSITLPKPAAWTWVKPSMQFRTLQYQVCNPGPGKVTPCADLIVSVFKLGDGGSVDANIGRWKNQFQNADGSAAQPTRSKRVVAGASVTRVDLKGAWKGMGMGEAQNNSEQLAAAIELPQETIYIRMVGPESAVEAARKDFEAMVDGLAPRAPLVK
jgi:hypothetical protein